MESNNSPWFRFVALLVVVFLAFALVSVVEAQQEITALIVKAPTNRDVQLQLVPTDKDTISAEANGRTIPVVIDENTATAFVNVEASDENNNNNKGGNKSKGKGKSHHKNGGGKSHKNDKGGNDEDSAAFTLKSSSSSSLVLLFVVAFSLVAFVGVSQQQQQQRGATTTLLVTLATILCVTVALTTTSEAQVNQTATATGFVPNYLILISHEYFVVYTIPRGSQITFYFFRASRALALVGATSSERLSNVATGLSTAGFSVTPFDATTATPSVAALRSFEFVLVFSDPIHSFFDKVALGDNLARAFDSGAKIITATFANAAEQPLGGRFADVTAGYLLLNPSAAATSTAAASLGSVLG